MWLVRPRNIPRHKRKALAFAMREARRRCFQFKVFNPARHVGLRVQSRGSGYTVRCQYADSFTGSMCTFDFVWTPRL